MSDGTNGSQKVGVVPTDTPLFGRASLRARLRRAMEALPTQGHPRVILLRGMAGAGKRAMCDWTADVAAEKGYHIFRHRHRDRREARLPEALRQWNDSKASQSQAPHSSKPPRVLLLEEVEWGRASLDWVASFLERSAASDGPPVLILLTATQEVLPQRPVEQVQVAQLSDRPAVETVELGALSDAAMRQFVRARIGGDRRTVAEIVDAADGNPGYAERMARRHLGEDLDDGQDGGDTVVARWRTGLEGFAREFGDRRAQALRCLEVLAAWRRAVPVSHWQEACERAGVEWIHLMPRALVSAGLGLEEGDRQRIKFTNPMARDVMESHARNAGRWNAIHEACADTLEPVNGEHATDKAARMCRHLREAGHLTRALPWLHRRITECAQAGELERARHLAGEMRDACARVELPPDHPWQLRWLLHRGWLDYFEGQIEAARQASSDLIRRMEDAPPEIAIEVWRLESAVAMQQGRRSRSWTAANRAIECVDDLQDPTYEAKIRDRRGRLLQHRGDLEEACREFERALDLFKHGERVDWVGGTHLALASVLTQMELYRRAIGHLESGRELFADAGMRRQLVRCYLGYGSVARRRERWSEALQWHVRALRLGREVGATRMSEVRYYLGYSMIGAGSYGEALEHLREVETEASNQRFTSLETRARVSRLCCEIGLERFEAARATLGDVIDTVEASSGHQGELGFLFERAGRLCVQLGEREMAEVLLMLSASQWQAIGRTGRRERILKLMRSD